MWGNQGKVSRDNRDANRYRSANRSSEAVRQGRQGFQGCKHTQGMGEVTGLPTGEERDKEREEEGK